MFFGGSGVQSSLQKLTDILEHEAKQRPTYFKTMGILCAVQSLFKEEKLGESKRERCALTLKGIEEDKMEVPKILTKMLKDASM